MTLTPPNALLPNMCSPTTLIQRFLIMTALFSPQTHANECVILLHGLARSDHSMQKIATSIENEGYKTINKSYPSTKYPVDKLANDAINQALEQCPKEAKIHFVTHSLGGILLRQYLSQNTISKLGRTVMLGPPNKGSEIVDKLGGLSLFKFINGPAGSQLGTSKDSVPNSLGEVNFELGIIAGTRHYNPIYSLFMPENHDGKVSVESTKVEGMTEHIELNVTHTFMMNDENVIKHTIAFLKKGSFIND